MMSTVEILDIIKPKNAVYCEELLSKLSPTVTEILFSHMGLEELCSFSRFKCVEALWLNDNKLKKIDGLDTNVQIKALYLHSNQISSLEPLKRNAAGKGCKGALSFLNHIETLSLYNNRLQDLQKTLKDIKHLTLLEDLGASS